MYVSMYVLFTVGRLSLFSAQTPCGGASNHLTLSSYQIATTHYIQFKVLESKPRYRLSDCMRHCYNLRTIKNFAGRSQIKLGLSNSFRRYIYVYRCTHVISPAQVATAVDHHDR